MSYRINVPEWVENESAYIAAAMAKIERNAEIGRMKRFNAWMENPENAAVYKAINGVQFGFLGKMFEAIEKYGTLTENQVAAVQKVLAQKAEKKAEFLAKDAGSEWIGTEGVRQDFELTIRVVNYFEGDFGAVYINIMNDANGNVVIYKGGKPLGIKGDTVKVKATVKAHAVREGVKQTVIARPKVL